MTTLSPVKTLEQAAIAQKIQNLLDQLPLAEKTAVEAQVSRRISEELAAKKEEIGVNPKKWSEFLKEQGLSKQDAQKRIKLLGVSSKLWSIGTVMLLGLAAPRYKEVCTELLKSSQITQEVVQEKMSEAEKLRRAVTQETKALTESKFIEWDRDINGDRVAKVEFHQDAGNKLEEVLGVFKEATGKDFPLLASEMLYVYENSEEYLNHQLAVAMKESVPENIPISQTAPGMRVRATSNSEYAGKEGTVKSFYQDGRGWCIKMHNEEIEVFLMAGEFEIIALKPEPSTEHPE